MTHRVTAVVVDHDWVGLGVAQGATSKPRVVLYEVEDWGDALVTLRHEYSRQHRSDAIVVESDLEVLSVTMVRVDG